jgi:hypothetical protein
MLNALLGAKAHTPVANATTSKSLRFGQKQPPWASIGQTLKKENGRSWSFSSQTQANGFQDLADLLDSALESVPVDTFQKTSPRYMGTVDSSLKTARDFVEIAEHSSGYTQKVLLNEVALSLANVANHDVPGLNSLAAEGSAIAFKLGGEQGASKYWLYKAEELALMNQQALKRQVIERQGLSRDMVAEQYNYWVQSGEMPAMGQLKSQATLSKRDFVLKLIALRDTEAQLKHLQDVLPQKAAQQEFKPFFDPQAQLVFNKAFGELSVQFKLNAFNRPKKLATETIGLGNAQDLADSGVNAQRLYEGDF